MLSSARTFSKQVLSHRTQIQHQTKSQLRNQQHPSRPKDQQQSICHDDDLTTATTAATATKHQVLEKMRLENRERKKRWRQVNEERNKDNDLRCRVTKRANQLYGAQASEAKEKWIGEEFGRRQQRRKEKEVRKRPSSPEELMVVGEKRMKCDERVDGILGAVSLGGFAGYAGVPAHQARAAYGFWKSTVEHQALEASAAPVRARCGLGKEQQQQRVLSRHGSPAAEQQQQQQHGVCRPPKELVICDRQQQQVLPSLTLPPLSSIVPEECLLLPLSAPSHHISSSGGGGSGSGTSNPTPVANAHWQQQHLLGSNPPPHMATPIFSNALLSEENLSLAAAAETLTTTSNGIGGRRPLSDKFFTTRVRSSSPPDHHSFYMPPMQPVQQRHLRPWEDDDTDHPVLSRSSTLVLPPLTTGSSASPRCIDDYEMNGLSEAAFSLMTLSSAANSAGAGSSSHSSSSASLTLGHY
ncbi:hypothetical protein LPJ66_006818 [Kickxella alabastrina]|uniref:Uncharacterized protein n=1 Tax=Kickxella alabastrina TaxID=61397 RepID=A0ACC1IEL4_9FUNG|nr:hypothetical protein LPJ66_006818 [Kickxella alabastrina]